MKLSSELRFLALIALLLTIWAISSLVRESSAPASTAAQVTVEPVEATIPSDRRLKQEILDLEYGMEELSSLRPVSYRYKDFPSRTRIGFIAQEVRPVLPEVVHLPALTPESTRRRFLSLSYSEMVPLLVKSIQEQQAMIESLERRLEELEPAPVQ